MGTKKQYAVLGLGKFGRSVAITLSELGYEVLGVDIDEDIVQDLSAQLTHVVAADISEEKNLKALGIDNFDVVVVGAGELGANLMATMICKEFGIPEVVSKALDTQHGKMLAKVGADKIIFSEKDMGIRVAHNLVSSNIMDYIELSNDISLMSIIVPTIFEGKSLAEANLRKEYNVNVVGIKHGGQTIVNPGPTTILNKGDEIILIGEHTAIQKMEEFI